MIPYIYMSSLTSSLMRGREDSFMYGCQYEGVFNACVCVRTTARWRCWRKRFSLLNWNEANSRPRNHSSRCIFSSLLSLSLSLSLSPSLFSF